MIDWLLNSEEPWTRYRTLVDLLGRPPDDPQVMKTRQEMLDHPQLKVLVDATAQWPGYPLKRHNDAAHLLHKLTVLADFGLTVEDPGIPAVVEALFAGQAEEGPFQILTNINPRYGGSGEDQWHWSLCDAPVTLHALIAFGAGDDPRLQQAVDHLLEQQADNGWPCATASKFRGPGRKSDPCPLANLLALRALALLPSHRESPAVQRGTQMLLGHWERQTERKIYLFGIGTNFRRLKYPFIWYDLLHMTQVLSQFPALRDDPRLLEMVELLASRADTEGRYTPSSIWMAWKGWSFGQKKAPSPWLTLLTHRILRRFAS